jgi:YVTN family beta-propeller protein
MGSRIELSAGRRSAAIVTTAATIVFILTLATGCGDTFRPVANPITQPGGDPAGVGNAIILAKNGNSPGTSSHIDVSGDTVVAVQSVQTDPRQATLVGGSVVVANYGVFGATPAVFGSLSIYPATAGPGASVATISVGDPSVPSTTNPKAAHAVFVHSTDNTNIYVAEQGEPGGPQDAVGIIPLSSTSGDAKDCSLPPQQAPCHITDASISNPTAIAQPVGSGKVYVANAGSGQVTIIDTATLAVTTKSPITVGTTPQAIVASADNNCLYVANKGSNSVSVISASSDTVAGTIAVGGAPTFLRFDNKLQRVYVVNNGGNSVSVINHAADCSATTATTVALGHSSPQSITVLADGSRAYVANTDGTVSVILTSSNTVKTFTGGANAVVAGPAAGIVSIGSSTDGAKVFVANNTGVISVIRTTDDSVIFQLMGTTGATKLPGAPSPQFVLMF